MSNVFNLFTNRKFGLLEPCKIMSNLFSFIIFCTSENTLFGFHKKFSVDLKVFSPVTHLGPYTKILFFEFSERFER